MKLNRARPFSFLSFVIFALLFIVILGIWVRGWWFVTDSWIHHQMTTSGDTTTQHIWVIHNAYGAFEILNTEITWPSYGMDMSDEGAWVYQSQEIKHFMWTSFAKPQFQLNWSVYSSTERSRYVTIPWWLIEVPPLIGFVFFFRRWRQRRRFGKGRCVVCGYDMRATPDRCPECGRQAAAEVAAAMS
jgi:hypothetical protein